MRVSFVVDGFNLYHSLKSAERQVGSRLRWLDLHGLCKTIVATSLPGNSALESIHYFSALASHLAVREPNVVARHRVYLEAIRSTGVEITLAKFKKKRHVHRLSDFSLRFPLSKRWFRIPVSSVKLCHYSHEEKETDVAIATKVLELLSLQRCDAIVIISGDTDLAPVIRTAQSLYQHSSIIIAFPFDRHNRDLARIATRSLKLSAQLYKSNQLPRVIQAPQGESLEKPASW